MAQISASERLMPPWRWLVIWSELGDAIRRRRRSNPLALEANPTHEVHLNASLAQSPKLALMPKPIPEEINFIVLGLCSRSSLARCARLSSRIQQPVELLLYRGVDISVAPCLSSKGGIMQAVLDTKRPWRVGAVRELILSLTDLKGVGRRASVAEVRSLLMQLGNLVRLAIYLSPEYSGVFVDLHVPFSVSHLRVYGGKDMPGGWCTNQFWPFLRSQTAVMSTEIVLLHSPMDLSAAFPKLEATTFLCQVFRDVIFGAQQGLHEI
jgi:hypothetical protein